MKKLKNITFVIPVYENDPALDTCKQDELIEESFYIVDDSDTANYMPELRVSQGVGMYPNVLCLCREQYESILKDERLPEDPMGDPIHRSNILSRPLLPPPPSKEESLPRESTGIKMIDLLDVVAVALAPEKHIESRTK